MPMIDADTHVDESEATWKKLEGTPYAKYIPVTIAMPPDEAQRAGYNPTNSRCWVVEGRLQNRAIRDDVNHPPRVLRELEGCPGPPSPYGQDGRRSTGHLPDLLHSLQH